MSMQRSSRNSEGPFKPTSCEEQIWSLRNAQLTRFQICGDLSLCAAAARPHLDDCRLLALQHVRHFRFVSRGRDEGDVAGAGVQAGRDHARRRGGRQPLRRRCYCRGLRRRKKDIHKFWFRLVLGQFPIMRILSQDSFNLIPF